MKKAILIFAMTVMIGGLASAQVSLGGRFYGGLTSGFEASLLYGMGGNTRIEADLGASFGVMTKTYDAVNIFGARYTYDGTPSYYVVTATGAYHWTFNIVKGFGWFVGPAAQLGLGSNHDGDFYMRLAVVAQGGVQYQFDFPLQVSLDVRPMLDFIHLANPRSLFDLGVAAGVRYCF
jgi:hypothetical protein